MVSRKDHRAPSSKGLTVVEFDKEGAYSFIKAPRYRDLPHESGPMARMWMTNPVLSKHANQFLGIDGNKKCGSEIWRESLLGPWKDCSKGRGVQTVADAMEKWIIDLKPGGSFLVNGDRSQRGRRDGTYRGPEGFLRPLDFNPGPKS